MLILQKVTAIVWHIIKNLNFAKLNQVYFYFQNEIVQIKIALHKTLIYLMPFIDMLEETKEIKSPKYMS